MTPSNQATAGSSRGPPGSSRPAKRAQVTVACEHCRRSKIKCDGVRPSCSRCQKSGIECTYAVPWSDASPIVALKRKYSELEQQSADQYDLLQRLAFLPKDNVQQVLDLLRNGQDVSAALQFARSPAPIPQPGRFRPARNSEHMSVTETGSMLQASNASIDREQISPNVRSPMSSADASRRLPSFEKLSASIEDPQRTVIPPSRELKPPSPPELRHVRDLTSVSVLRLPTWRHDSRLDRACAKDWGVSYLDDEAFRNIICSYLVWDHQAWRFFDEDDFLDGLVHESSISCSPSLVHAVIAFGSKNYIWIDAETADAAGKAAAVEAERLWEEDPNDTPLATAAAGLLIWNSNGALGYDKSGEPYVLRVKQIADHLNMYDDSTYTTKDAKINRAKAVFIWGVYSWLAFCEITLGSETSLPRLPPDLTPLLKEHTECQEWWTPWPRNDSRMLALTDEIFLARCSIMVIWLEIGTLQKKHKDSALTREFLDASLALCRRLQSVWSSAGEATRSLDQKTPQLLLLHCWYHYAILQLFRPFVTTPTSPSIHSAPLEAANLSIEPALSISTSAAHELRRLLGLGSTIFAGLQAPIIFSQVAVSVAVDTLPSASALSAAFSPSAAVTFVLALRMLYRMGGAFVALRFALLGIKQTAMRLQLLVPPEAEDIFGRVQDAVSSGETLRSPRANWVVDLSMSGADVQAARLESLVRALGDLGVA